MVSHESGYYRTTILRSRPAGALSPAAPGVPISPKLAPTDTPEVTQLRLASAGRILPNRSLCTFTHNHVFTNMSGLSLYCCYTRPGFHRSAVLDIRAFTVPLFYSQPNYTQTGIPMDLANYPLNQVGSGTGITDRSEKSIQRPDKPDRSEISGRCPTYLMSCYFCTSNASLYQHFSLVVICTTILGSNP